MKFGHEDEKLKSTLWMMLLEAEEKPDYQEFYLLNHSQRVAQQARNLDEFFVALAHDLVEDGHCTFADLIDIGFNDKRIHSLSLVTRNPSMTYMEYIQNIVESGDPVANAVKMYDLLDHLHPMNWHWLKPGLITRYTRAMEAIAQANRGRE